MGRILLADHVFHKEYRRQGRPHLLVILRVKAEPYDFAAIIFAVACFEFLSL